MSDEEDILRAIDDCDEPITIGFDLMEWAEIQAALLAYKKTIDPGTAVNSFCDVVRIMKKINVEICGEDVEDPEDE
jgi:hypothetical protein